MHKAQDALKSVAEQEKQEQEELLDKVIQNLNDQWEEKESIFSQVSGLLLLYPDYIEELSPDLLQEWLTRQEDRRLARERLFEARKLYQEVKDDPSRSRNWVKIEQLLQEIHIAAQGIAEEGCNKICEKAKDHWKGEHEKVAPKIAGLTKLIKGIISLYDGDVGQLTGEKEDVSREPPSTEEETPRWWERLLSWLRSVLGISKTRSESSSSHQMDSTQHAQKDVASDSTPGEPDNTPEGGVNEIKLKEIEELKDLIKGNLSSLPGLEDCGEFKQSLGEARRWFEAHESLMTTWHPDWQDALQDAQWWLREREQELSFLQRVKYLKRRWQERQTLEELLKLTGETRDALDLLPSAGRGEKMFNELQVIIQHKLTKEYEQAGGRFRTNKRRRAVLVQIVRTLPTELRPNGGSQ
jgi:hypothetical protein